MALVKITVSGLNEYFYKLDNTDSLFKDMILPDGIDKDLVIDSILLQCGEFEPLYADGPFMKKAIEVWSKKWFHTFEKWHNAINLEYNPIDNYDRYEDSTDISDNNVNGTTNNNRSAYDTSGYVPHDQNVTETASDGQLIHYAHLHGNIGVTTTQQMLQAEYDIAKWSLYDQIVDIFQQELCLAIY